MAALMWSATIPSSAQTTAATSSQVSDGMALGVWGLGFRVRGLGFRVSGLKFPDSGLRVWGFTVSIGLSDGSYDLRVLSFSGESWRGLGRRCLGRAQTKTTLNPKP